MKFDINNYKGKYVMHCKTEEEAKEFCDHVRNNNNPSIVFRMYGKNTCFRLNSNNHASKNYYEEHGYTILEWSDFTTEFTKADLQNGMIVEYANGWKRMVLNGNLLGIKDGHAPLTNFLDDLKCKWDQDLNINKVYTCKAIDLMGLPEAFYDHNLTLIWERKEEPKPVEMTIEEICKALGKEIKIVKG